MRKATLLILLGVIIIVNTSCLPGISSETQPTLTNSATPPLPAFSVTPTQTTTPATKATLTPIVSSTVTPMSLLAETPSNPPTESPLDTPANTPTATPGAAVFIDGYGGNVFTAKDNLLNSRAGNRNIGAHNNFELSPIQNSLLEFDLSSIPVSATCLSATLYLYNSYGDGGGAPISTIYSLSEANAAWLEGAGNIDIALEGESTWDGLAADGNGGVKIAWAGSPGASMPGVDYEVDAIGSFAWDPNSPLGTEFAIPLDTSRVLGWFGEDNTNYGIVILTAGGGGHVAQSDHFTPELRPKLVVQYTLNP